MNILLPRRELILPRRHCELIGPGLLLGDGSGGSAPPENTFDPAAAGPDIVLSNGNLTATKTTGGWASVRGALAQSSGTRRIVMTWTGGFVMVAVCAAGVSLTTYVGANSSGWAWSRNSASPQRWHNNVASSYGTDWAAGAMVALDVDFSAGTVTGLLYASGTWNSQGTMYSGLAGPIYYGASMFGPASVTIDPTGWA
jgi:hypothetical protein